MRLKSVTAMSLALAMCLWLNAFASEKVQYKGAFGPTNWAQGWTALSTYGLMAAPASQSGNVITVTDASIQAGETVFWTADNTYVLDGIVWVDEGATLYIEAGTVIKGKPGEGLNSSALVVARGAKIYAEGTSDRPIIFTAESDDLSNPLVPDPGQNGLWGGLIMLGNATINRTPGETQIEGIDPNEPRNLYGGNDDNDNSGVLRYISIRHGGSTLFTDDEINGLTLGGVGRGTTISYVEIWANKDDGIEIFGGTVNCDHIISAFCADDAIDLDFGYRGNMQFVFAIQADSTGDHLGEHDGADETEVGALPLASAKIYNATYLGAGMASKTGARLFRMRENFGGAYKNCIFGDYDGWGITIEDKYDGNDARDRLEAGQLQIQNNIWFNFSAGNDYAAIGNNDQWTVDYLSDAANGNTIEDPGLTLNGRAPFSQSLDPRPATSGPAYSNLADYPDDTFFAKVDYKGAFGSTNWARGWTALSTYGLLTPATTPGGNTITVTDASIQPGASVFWTADNQYILDGIVWVDAGATLHIEDGTVIKGKPGEGLNSSALVVARGGKIYAEGTGLRPIIFTAESDDLANPLVPDPGQNGLWGGLIILGNATINRTPGETQIEGIDPNEPRNLYGGNDDNDNSGVLRYISIRHGGSTLFTDDEINGLTLGGVGRGTKISNTEIWANKDDGIEIFGGTVEIDHLISAFCADDAVDLDFGFRGALQYVFAIQADSTGDHLGEHDGADETEVGATPKAFAVISNATYLGAGMNSKTGARIFRMRENFGGAYINSIFGDYDGWGVTIEDKYEATDARDRLEADELFLLNNIWFNLSAGNTWEAIGNNDAWTVAYLSNPNNGNTVEDPGLTLGTRQPFTNIVDPRPAPNGPAYQNVREGEIVASVRAPSGHVPTEFAVSQNYPNPFNPSTTIKYSLSKETKVLLTVYNLLGQKIATLIDKVNPAGEYTVTWNASKLASGVYLYKLDTGAQTYVRKMTLLK